MRAAVRGHGQAGHRSKHRASPRAGAGARAALLRRHPHEPRPQRGAGCFRREAAAPLHRPLAWISTRGNSPKVAVTEPVAVAVTETAVTVRAEMPGAERCR